MSSDDIIFHNSQPMPRVVPRVSRAAMLNNRLLMADDDGRFGNRYLRFTIVYGLLVVAITTAPLWLVMIRPNDYNYVYWSSAAIAIAIAFITLAWIAIALAAVRNYNRMQYLPQPKTMKAVAAARARRFNHVFIVPCYVDPMELLIACLQSLQIQQRTLMTNRIVVVVTFEARTPAVDEKMQRISQLFSDKFSDLLVIKHHLLENEMPGGCSNKNFALRRAFAYMEETAADEAAATSTTVTTCDTDTLFAPTYVEALEAVYNYAAPSIHVEHELSLVWQPPTFYNYDLDCRPFFVRVTGIMRSMMMLGGLISWNLNPMSVFSYPLSLMARIGAINPRYGVDDIIWKARAMSVSRQRVPVVLLPCPVISGPTNSSTFSGEVREWAAQIRRWIVGSSESFHYFLIHLSCSLPFFSAFLWFLLFFIYYGVLICAGGWLIFLAGLPFHQLLMGYDATPRVIFFSLLNNRLDVGLRELSLLSFILQYVVFAIAFLIDRSIVRLIGIDEKMQWWRNVLHFFSAPFVLLAYSMVALIGLIRFMFIGKALAKHDMSGKDGLKKPSARSNSAEARPLLINSANANNVEDDDYEANDLEAPKSIHFGAFHATLEQFPK